MRESERSVVDADYSMPTIAEISGYEKSRPAGLVIAGQVENINEHYSSAAESFVRVLDFEGAVILRKRNLVCVFDQISLEIPRQMSHAVIQISDSLVDIEHDEGFACCILDFEFFNGFHEIS